MREGKPPRRMRSTDRRLLAGEDEEQARRLELALELGDVFAVVVDRAGRLRWMANPPLSVANWYRKMPREVMGDLRAAPFEEATNEAMDRGERVRRLVELELDDGLHVFDLVAEPICDERGELLGCRGASRDVTLLTQANRELARAKEGAEEANRTKDRFFALLSHELRTPLTPVLALGSEMQKRDDLPLDVRNAFATIRRNIERQARLVDDLLDLSRLSLDRLRVDRHPIDIGAALGDALELEVPLLGDIRIATDIQDDLWVLGDRARLAQVFGHLLRNALQHAGDGGRITIAAQQRDEEVVIDFRDEGVGIDPARISGIFEPFQETSGNTDSLGIGLSVARLLVERHGGYISAHSAGRGRGSCFRIVLPLTGRRPSTPVDRLTVSGPTSRRILYVEDDPDTRDTFCVLLRRYGYLVHACSSVAAAARALATNVAFDILLCDLGLPDGEGYEVVALLGERDIPAVALTGYGAPEDVAAAHAAGFRAHLTKPVALDALLGTLDAVLADQRDAHTG